MSDDVKKAGPRPAVHPDPEVTRPSDRDAPAADEAAADTYVQAEPKVDLSVEPSNAIFRSREDVLRRAAHLRELMKSRDGKVRFLAISDYRDLLEQVEDDSPELLAGAEALRGVMWDPEHFHSQMIMMAWRDLVGKWSKGAPEVYREAAELRRMIEEGDRSEHRHANLSYRDLRSKFERGSSEVYREAAALRELMESRDAKVRSSAVWLYGFLSEKFLPDSPEVYSGAVGLRRLMEDEDAAVRDYAVHAYALLSANFLEGSPEVYVGARLLLRMVHDPDDDVPARAVGSFGDVASKFAEGSPELDALASDLLQVCMETASLREHIEKAVGRAFHRLSHVGFLKAGFEHGAWIDGLGLTEKAARNLRGFAGQSGFIGFRDSVVLVLDMLARREDGRQRVLERIFEATDPTKWKSVRNTLRTLRALSLLDSLPDEVSREFYASHGGLEGDTRARLRADVERALLAYLKESIGDAGGLAVLFEDEAPADRELAAHWRLVKAVREYLSNRGLLLLFAQSASFMDEEGVGVLRTLFEDLVESTLVDGELRYQSRYDRMVDLLGFSPAFVERWGRGWSKVREAADLPRDEGDVRRLAMDQAAAQLAVHVNSAQGVPGEFVDLPDRLRALTEALKRYEADEDEIEGLYVIMELNYQKIREAYGDLFANSRVDIKNLVAALKKGIKVAKDSEVTEISGLVERLALHGKIPSETCQRLNMLWSETSNGKGQPLNKIIWGQFKIANYLMDGEVIARRVLEVTRDEDGREHLRAERPYSAGGFARLAQFDEDIVEHARGLGISRDRVHFLDRHGERGVPGPLATGARIYRDSRHAEVNSAFTRPFRPLSTTAMPMMSARMMLRTGT